MILSQNDIRSRGIILNTKDENFHGPSYLMTIDKVFEVDQNEEGSTKYRIQPRGQVLVTTKETFNMPMDIIGYTTIKNSYSTKGIYAINIGLVDPTYKGPISTILINFGNKPFNIKSGDTVLRMTFHKFDPADNDNNFDLKTFNTRKEYVNERRGLVARYLGPSFLSIESVKSEIWGDINNKFWKWITAVVLAVFLIGLISFFSALAIFQLDKWIYRNEM